MLASRYRALWCHGMASWYRPTLQPRSFVCSQAMKKSLGICKLALRLALGSVVYHNCEKSQTQSPFRIEQAMGLMLDNRYAGRAGLRMMELI